jgi:hypothetical protein
MLALFLENFTKERKLIICALRGNACAREAGHGEGRYFWKTTEDSELSHAVGTIALLRIRNIQPGNSVIARRRETRL